MGCSSPAGARSVRIGECAARRVRRALVCSAHGVGEFSKERLQPDVNSGCGGDGEEHRMAGTAETQQQDTARPEERARTASRPSELKITDLRTATVGWDRWTFTIIRIDTNQGLSGYG